MQLSCPNCGVRYDVAVDHWPRAANEDGALQLRPRKVRCKLCQEIWQAVPEKEDILELENPISSAKPRVPSSADARPDDRAPPPEKPPRRWPWLLAGGLGLCALGAAAAGGLLRPEAIGLPALTTSFPRPDLPELRLGPIPVITLPAVVPPALTLRADVRQRTVDGARIWEVRGSLLNATGQPQSVAPVELRFVDSSGRVLGQWITVPNAQTVAAGEAVAFETSAINPPAGATQLQLLLKPASLGRR